MTEYHALLAEAKAAGADFIKLMVSGLMDFSACGVLTEEPLTGGEIHDLIAAAHDMGYAVMAHCNGAAAVKNAVAAGVDSIEHGAYLDDEACRILAESHTVWTRCCGGSCTRRRKISGQWLLWAVLWDWGAMPERFAWTM